MLKNKRPMEQSDWLKINRFAFGHKLLKWSWSSLASANAITVLSRLKNENNQNKKNQLIFVLAYNFHHTEKSTSFLVFNLFPNLCIILWRVCLSSYQSAAASTLCKSMLAGVAGAAFTNPLDVIRNEMFKTNLTLVESVSKLNVFSDFGQRKWMLKTWKQKKRDVLHFEQCYLLSLAIARSRSLFFSLFFHLLFMCMFKQVFLFLHLRFFYYLLICNTFATKSQNALFSFFLC